LPFVGNMSDSFDFVRKMWGVTGLPGLPTVGGITQFAQGLPQALPSMITPTLDVGELDKRIADLRAVEQWLALNANMLRATIQSLEVQRNTIATLKSFGGSMLSTVTRSGSLSAGTQAPADLAGTAYLRRAEARASARRQAAAEAAAATAPSVSMPAPAAPASTRRSSTRRRAAKEKQPHAEAVMPLNPGAWWGVLQDQFARVAAAAAAEAARPDKNDAAGDAKPTPPSATAPRATGAAKPATRARKRRTG
jgi:hypothetical protein